MNGTILLILALAVGLLPADPAGAETDAELLARGHGHPRARHHH